MDSGRIMPVIRNFFGQTVSIKGNDRERSSKDNPQQDQQKKEQQPSKEDAAHALAFLKSQETFIKAGLKAEVRELDGIFIIQVTDNQGSIVKTIRGVDLWRLLAQGKSTERDPVGHILDRRL